MENYTAKKRNEHIKLINLKKLSQEHIMQGMEECKQPNVFARSLNTGKIEWQTLSKNKEVIPTKIRLGRGLQVLPGILLMLIILNFTCIFPFIENRVFYHIMILIMFCLPSASPSFFPPPLPSGSPFRSLKKKKSLLEDNNKYNKTRQKLIHWNWTKQTNRMKRT